jgi:hypothetical protein
MFALLMSLLGLTGVFYLASATQHSGWGWSYELCQQSGPICDHPNWLLIGLVILIGFGMLRTMSQA